MYREHHQQETGHGNFFFTTKEIETPPDIDDLAFVLTLMEHIKKNKDFIALRWGWMEFKNKLHVGRYFNFFETFTKPATCVQKKYDLLEQYLSELDLVRDRIDRTNVWYSASKLFQQFPTLDLLKQKASFYQTKKDLVSKASKKEQVALDFSNPEEPKSRVAKEQ